MHHRFLLLVYLSLVLGCNQNVLKDKPLSYTLPKGAEVIMSTRDVINSKDYIKDLELFGLADSLDSQISERIDSLNLEELVVGYYTTANRRSFVITGKLELEEDTLASQNKLKESKSQRLIQKNNSLFSVMDGEIITISNDSLLLNSNEQIDHSLIEKLYKVQRDHTGFSLLTTTSIQSIPFSLYKPEDSISASGSEVFLTVNSNNRRLKYSGIISPDSSSLKKMTKPHGSELLNAIPYTATEWQLQTINHDSPEIENQSDEDIALDSVPDFRTLSLEQARIKFKEETLMAFHLGSTSLLEEDLNLADGVEEYRDIPIYEFKWDNTNNYSTDNLLGVFASNYLVIFENYLILGNSVDTLKAYLSAFLNNTTVAQSDSFKRLSLDLRSSFSYMSYGDQTTIKRLFPDLDLNYNRTYFQLSPEDDFIHINGLLADYEKITNTQPVEELLSINLETDILKSPQLVDNHLNGGKDILVQDIENNLYLISNKGKIFWKKRINGPILGKVKQIDMYKNGRLQLAFCTESKLYVLDRNGKDVSPFPKNFRDPITQPLAVFDYDNSRNYRLLISQGKELLMLDARGKRVSGFKYDKSNTINSVPKHFRVGRKDYIVFKGDDKLKILNRRGQTRINVRDKITFSNNDLFLYQSQFTTTSSKGKLIQVDTKGKLRIQNLNLPEDHQLVTTSKTLVTQTEDRLNIKLKSVDLDYGIYSDPQIFYLNDKIYISTTDKQSKKVFLFDSQAQPIKGFPVFGNSQIDMANIDNSRGLEIVVQTDSKSISVLRLR